VNAAPSTARGGAAAAMLWLLVAAVVAVPAADAHAWSWLGVRIRDLSEQEMDDLAKQHGIREGFGVVIVEVIADAPAARAGIHPGDVVVAFQGRPVTDTRLLQRLVARAPQDGDVRLTVLRRAGRQALPVRLAAMPRPVAGERIAAEFGFVLREPDAPAGQEVRPASSAPSVTFVMRDSAAERAGLEVGDVLLQVNDQAVLTRDAARTALGDVLTDRALRLTVRRGPGQINLTLGPPLDAVRP
jgi:serine protease Do